MGIIYNRIGNVGSKKEWIKSSLGYSLIKEGRKIRNE